MNVKDSTHRDYQFYLLRLWRDDTRQPWRASLQSAATEQTVHFADIEALFAFLESHTQTVPHMPRVDSTVDSQKSS